jgi:hypothetical protein
MSTQTPVQAMTTDGSAHMGVLGRLAAIVNVAFVVILCFTPFTAVLVLGWIMRLMRREIVIEIARLGQPDGRRDVNRRTALRSISALPQLADTIRFPGWWKGLWGTVRSAFRAILAICLAVLPFGALLLLSWWAGWENSFNKGYEQAWVGPVTAAAGILLALFTLVHLPMALAHHAAEERVGAIWDIGLIRRLIAKVRWRYLILTLVTVVLSVPLLLLQILPTFIENIAPDLASKTPAEIQGFALGYYGAATVYLVFSLFVLRRWAARLYARAALLEKSNELRFVRQIAEQLDRPDMPSRRVPSRVGGIVTGMFMLAGWLAFLTGLYVAQFANHAWWNWINFPLTGLPWIFRTL